MLKKNKFLSGINELLIDKNIEETPYPDDMVNAYNWGLVHASWILEGRTTKFIKDWRDNDLS